MKTSFLAVGPHISREVHALATSRGPVRRFVVGNAGSGKSSLLSHLQQHLWARGVSCSTFDERTDVESLPASEVLLVDDLHELDDTRVEAVRRRCVDPNASLVVASRPWPRGEHGSDIVRRLERAAPAIVLGHVSRSAASVYLEARNQAMPTDCLEQIVTMTGGVAWLVHQALAIHGTGPCVEPSHTGLRHALEAQILHRLDTVDPSLRAFVESSCLGDLLAVGSLDHATATRRVIEAYSEGLLRRNGSPVPVVNSAVRGALPAHRLLEVGAQADDRFRTRPGAVRRLGGQQDASDLASSFLRHGDRLLERDPERARQLYHSALAAGARESDVSLRRALAAWHAGDLDGTSAVVDAAMSEEAEPGKAAFGDLAAAVWAARCLMATGSDLHAALGEGADECRVTADIAHLAAGRTERCATAEGGGDGQAPGSRRPSVVPSTRSIALGMLDEGLRASLAPDSPRSAVTRLVHASHLYTASGSTDPVPELPAVIAAAVAVGAGELATAQRVVDAAVAGAQGGGWARRRLLLWRAWVALQGEQPRQASAALDMARESPLPVSPRDELMLQTILVTLARRYGDVPALESAWRTAKDAVRHLDVDLFLLLPLSSLVSAAARIGDVDTLAPQCTQGLGILGRLGSPPLWSIPLRWAGVQQGILLNRPDAVAPHAKALVAASSVSPVAETMARAGAVWVSVLRGAVDPEAVERAGNALASIGLAWDGARLAAHGAGLASDRRVSARLLTFARHLHPSQANAPRADVVAPQGCCVDAGATQQPLSQRELEVARLVLQGKTYAEIGETIFISPRTVEHHVAHIKRRLSATSRSQLMAKLRQVTASAPGVVPYDQAQAAARLSAVGTARSSVADEGSPHPEPQRRTTEGDQP